MPHTDWRSRAGATFTCEKQPATGTRGMVVTNHPLASAAGAEMLAAGGNAIDAAIAAFFTLTVVEPMMVGMLGGGMAHIRLADGTPPRDRRPEHRAARHRPDHLHARSERRARNDGYDRPQERASAPPRSPRPGNLMGWCEALARFGTFSLADVMEPAIRHAVARLPRHAVSARMRRPTAPPTWRAMRRSPGCICPAARRSSRARGWSPATMPRRCAPSPREGPELLYGGALGRHYAGAHGEDRRLSRAG